MPVSWQAQRQQPINTALNLSVPKKNLENDELKSEQKKSEKKVWWSEPAQCQDVFTKEMK